MLSFTKKQQRAVIFAINIGNCLEWYELSLYAYWAPVISNIFFDDNSPSISMIKTFLILALGYLIRPLGGIFFGRLGDRIGRRRALLASIIFMTIPTLIMAFLPSYAAAGIFAPILLSITRLLQSFPAGGELPGAFCYLYESSQSNNRKYLTSWGFLGNQVGITLALVECYLFETYFTVEDLRTWGWRLSFVIGSLIGFYGFYLRYKLKETPFWEKLEKTNKIVNAPLFKILKSYKAKIGIGMAYCALTAVSFAALSTFFPLYFGKLLGTSYTSNLLITIFILIIITIPLTLFGRLADKYDYKKIMIFSTLSIMVLLIALRFLGTESYNVISLIICILIMLLFACLYAILPFVLTNLFPTTLRFTGVGIAYNIADSFLGGFTPVGALYLLKYTDSQSYYFWTLILFGLISLAAYLKIEKRKDYISGNDG